VVLDSPLAQLVGEVRVNFLCKCANLEKNTSCSEYDDTTWSQEMMQGGYSEQVLLLVHDFKELYIRVDFLAPHLL